MSSQQKSLLLQLIVEAVDKAGNVLTNVKNSLDGVQNAAKNAGSATGQVGQQIEKNLKQAANVADELKKKLEDTGRALFGMGTALAGIGASLGLPLAAATREAANFEAEMNKVKAFVDFSPNTDEAEKQFQQLTETARSFDQYAPVNVAQAITEIGKAGQNTEQIIASLAPTLNLAFVENRDMRQTAEDLVSIMNAMGMEANQTTRAADVLAKTSAATTTSMGGLTEGMKFAAPVAAKLGMNIELTAAFLGQFAQNGIKGEMGGTGFRRVMEDMLKPTTEARATLEQLNVEIAKTPGGQVDAIKTFERLRDAQMNAAQAAAIFGTQGMTIALAATKDIEKIKALAKENDNASGSLQQTVDKINAGLNPALGRLTNALSNASIQFAGPFLTSLKFVVDGLASVIRSATEFGQAHPIIAKVAVGFVGFFSMIAAAAGVVTLALAGLSFGAGQMRAGWQVLIGMSARVTQFFRDKIGLIQRETQTINENTGALQRNAQARDAGERRGAQGIIAGKGGGASGARGPGIGGVGLALGVAGLTTTITQAATAETGFQKVLSVVEGISTVLFVIPNPITKIIGLVGMGMSLVGNLAASMGLFKGKADESAVSVGLMRDTIASFVGRGDSIEQFSDAYKKSFGKDIPDEVKKSFELMKDLSRAAGDDNTENQKKTVEDVQKEYVKLGKTFEEFSQDYTRAFKSPPDALVKGSFDRFVEESKKAGNDVDTQLRATMMSVVEHGVAQGKNYGQIVNSMLSIYQKATGKMMIPESERAAFDQIYKDIVGKTKDAVAQVGNEWQKLNTSGGAKKTTEQLLQDSKNAADTQLKLIQDSAKLQDDLDKITYDQKKTRIESTIQSEIQAKQAIDRFITEQSDLKISRAQAEYDQTRDVRDRAYNEQRALYQKQIADGVNAAEVRKNLVDLDKNYTEIQIADAQKLSQVVVSEIQNQVKAKEDQVKKVQDLEKQLRDEQQATADALNKVGQANLNEFQKLQSNIAIVSEKLQQANSLTPTMPEKALELFKQVRSESAGLIQDVEGFNQKLRDVAYSTQDAVKKIRNVGLEGAAKYNAEVKDIQDVLQRARDAEAASRFRDAENLYKQVQSMAQGLTGSAVKTGNAEVDKANLEKAKNDALNIVMVANTGLTTVVEKQKAQTEVTNKLAKENIEKADKAIKDLINQQIKSAQDLIIALDHNTAALQGKLAQTRPGQTGQTEATQTAPITSTVIGQTSTGAGTEITPQTAQAIAGAMSGKGLTPSPRPGYEPAPQGTIGYSLTTGEQGLIDETNLMLAQTDKLLAESRAQSESMAQKEGALKYLESVAGNLDRNERAGYGPVTTSPLTGKRLTDQDLEAQTNIVMGRPMTGADVDAAESNIQRITSTIFESFQNRLSAFVQGVSDKASSSLNALRPPNAEAQSLSQSIGNALQNILIGAGDTFNQSIDEAVKRAFDKGMSVEIIVKNDRDATLGTVKRII